MEFVRITSPHFLDGPSPAAAEMQQEGDLVISARPGPGEQIEATFPIHRAVADAVFSVAVSGKAPFANLGDCCQVIPVMAGLERAGFKPALVWLDAHGDFNTWQTTPSGFLGGMPLAMLTGRGDQRMMDAVGLAPIDDARVVLSDGRDLDPGERDNIVNSAIRFIPRLENLDPASLPAGPLYLHFDTDIIDATEAPAFLYPVKGGPSAEVARKKLVEIMATGRVVAVSTTVGWDTAKDADGRTLDTVRHAVAGITGAPDQS